MSGDWGTPISTQSQVSAVHVSSESEKIGRVWLLAAEKELCFENPADMTLTFELVFAVVITVVAGLLAWLYLRKNSSGLEQDAKENVEGSETVEDLTEDAADNERRLPQVIIGKPLILFLSLIFPECNHEPLPKMPFRDSLYR